MDEAFKLYVSAIDGNTAEVGFQVTEGHYLYKDKISVSALSDTARAGHLDLPAGEMKVDEFFGEVEVYHDDLFVKVPIARATPEAMDLEVAVGYQGCADAGLCYPPQTRNFTVALPQATTVSALPVAAAPVSEQGFLAQIITSSSIWTMAGVFFLAGLGLALTPCVLPMIPILSGIIAGEGDDVSAGRGFSLALSYVLGMAIVYTVAGIAAAGRWRAAAGHLQCAVGADLIRWTVRGARHEHVWPVRAADALGRANSACCTERRAEGRHGGGRVRHGRHCLR